MKVANREQLVRFGGFDDSYLNIPQLLSRWRLETPSLPTQFALSATIGIARTPATRTSTRAAARGRTDDETQSPHRRCVEHGGRRFASPSRVVEFGQLSVQEAVQSLQRLWNRFVTATHAGPSSYHFLALEKEGTLTLA